jgi:superfamily II DNA helicase RecQ
MIPQNIEAHSFDVITISPELILDDRMWALWSRPKFYNSVRRIIADEAHCIETWGTTFRPPYKQLSRLYCLLDHKAQHIQWYLTSATLSRDMVSNILTTLEMRRFTFKLENMGRTLWMQRSTDRANLHFMVCRMEGALNSYRDLGFLVPKGLSSSDPRPLPFLVYCNTRNNAEQGSWYLRSRMAPDIQHLIIYVHSGMSERHRKEAVTDFRSGAILGLFCTEALGLVCHPFHML